MKKEIVISRTEQLKELMSRIESETCILWSSGAKPTCSGIIGEGVGKFPLTISINDDNRMEWSTLGLNDAKTTIDRFIKMLKVEKVEKVSYKVEGIGEFETQKEALEAIENSYFAKFALGAKFSTIVRQSSNPALALSIWLRSNKDEVIKFLDGE
jgi:hypothetical protein